MEFVIIWALVGLFATRETIPDLAAAVKGNPPPSHERRMRRLEARGADTSSETKPGTFRQAWEANKRHAAERAAFKRDAKHEATMRHLEENRDRISDAKYQKLQARQARKQTALDKFTQARRIVTETPERVREARAWRRNTSEPDLLDREWDEDTGDGPDAATNGDQSSSGGTDATVLAFARPKRSEPGRISPEAQIVGDPADPATWQGTDQYGRDIQTGRGSRYIDENGDLIHDSDEYVLTESEGESPERAIVRQHQLDLKRLTEDQVELLRRWRQANHTFGQIEVSPEEWNSLPVDVRARLLDESERAGITPLTRDSHGELKSVGEVDTEAAGWMQDVPGSGGSDPDSAGAPLDPDTHMVPNPYWRLGDPDHTRLISKAELNRGRELADRRSDERERERERAHELEKLQRQTESEPGDQSGSDENTSTTEEKGNSRMVDQTDSQQSTGEQEGGPSYETTNLTATLQRTQASSTACRSRMDAYDEKLAQLQAEYSELATQIAGLEAQIAVLQAPENENSGEQIQKLEQARDALTGTQGEVAEQITHARNTLQAYEAAAAAFDGAYSEFSKQKVGQDFYTAVSGAGSKTFLTQG